MRARPLLEVEYVHRLDAAEHALSSLSIAL